VSRLAARGLTAGYPGRTVLHGLDVELPDGRLTVIVGPNASGKSTLLRTLARMLRRPPVRPCSTTGRRPTGRPATSPGWSAYCRSRRARRTA
jgi:ABC-type multidrug transport system ATPase subunit